MDAVMILIYLLSIRVYISYLYIATMVDTYSLLVHG